ncbi:VWA domain-containing protein [Patiriisocius marinistellae]|uniref:VWA domain-containing protein n=1 Tax=Patiriisocius marinistellae TaxID=2494560 RepID=A0A5J4FV51_9FLAO|nr:VWA domain-containing protein [Patiriisocius marinistellae]GEQ86577.1 VWA domain-containing protein [Patiriisocius marinistellae]
MKNLLYILLLIVVLPLQAQKITIIGIITESSGLPLAGVNIVEKQTSNGTQADFDGNYSITVNIGSELVFSYVGFDSKTVKISGRKSVIDVVLEEGATLSEVVVTGYSGVTKQRKSLGYAVSRMDAESIESKRNINVVRSLNGKVPGVKITSNGGATGSGTKFIVRGKSSMPTNQNHLNNRDDVIYNNTENEDYDIIRENIFKNVITAPLSTFSIDVDKAGYSNVRRMINNGQKIPKDAVKIEEMVNYFQYDYPQPASNEPFSITTEMTTSPWNSNAQLVRIGLKGKDITKGNMQVPASNLVFLLDVSGSMNSENKLPLLKSALRVLVDQLRQEDKVSIVVYAGEAGLVLPPTSGANKAEILNAIDRLNAGGSTAGGAGINLAYNIAEENFIKNGNNRVILATDGDFNVGASSNRSMEELIEEKRKSGVFLTCLGFGMGNYQDSKMETLADKGNGNHAYIDTMQEARKVLGSEFFGTLYTIAKDVKLQVEFNPNVVQAYRLVGYENRLLNDEDFKDDTKDAGELGSGHSVTAFYEVIPVGVKSPYLKDIGGLKYTKSTKTSNTDEVLTVKFRYKEPDGKKSKLIVKTMKNNITPIEQMNEDFKFSAAVALFGMQLRHSIFTKTFKKEDVLTLAQAGKGLDKEGYRAEFIRLVKSSI